MLTKFLKYDAVHKDFQKYFDGDNLTAILSKKAEKDRLERVEAEQLNSNDLRNLNNKM